MRRKVHSNGGHSSGDSREPRSIRSKTRDRNADTHYGDRDTDTHCNVHGHTVDSHGSCCGNHDWNAHHSRDLDGRSMNIREPRV